MSVINSTNYYQEKIEELEKEIISLKDKLNSAEILAEDSAYRFKLIAEFSPYPISIFNKDNNYLYLNPAFIEIFGYTLDDVPNREKWFEKAYPDPEYRNQVLYQWTNSNINGFNIEKKIFDISCKNGNIRKVLFNAYRIDEDSYMLYYDDITERLDYEEQLKIAKEKAEESDKLKSAFLANMSHEIRTPMNAIIGFSNLLLNDDIPQEKAFEFLNLINKNGNILIRLIDDIVDLSRMEAGLINILQTKCYVNTLMSDLYTVFKEEKNKLCFNNIQLVVKKQMTNDDFYIISDAARIKQVLCNLIANALKFTEKGYVEFGYNLFNRNEQNFISFYVKDTGIGIPEDELTTIFNNFRQIDYKHTRKYGGTGLGLAVSKKTAQLLGGSIEVESVLGAGSIFRLNIPYSSELLTSSSKLSQNSQITNHNSQFIKPDWSGKSFLIAEDDENSLKYLLYCLESFKAKIIIAKNGQEAIDIIISNNNIDIVLMDIQMPEVNGLNATSEIKKIKNSIPIIAITAYAMTEERQLCLDAGCDDYLAKPVNLIDLISKISEYI